MSREQPAATVITPKSSGLEQPIKFKQKDAKRNIIGQFGHAGQSRCP